MKLNLGNLTVSEYKRVCIVLDSDYKWGSGWTREQSRKFENIVYSALKKAGYELRQSDISFCPPDLIKTNTKTKLYLHPMEFTGYATEKDIEKIVDILKGCSCIYGLQVAISDCYDLSDIQYCRILQNNMSVILKFLKEYKKRYGTYTDADFEFARRLRIPRIGDNSGLSGSDCDINFVSIVKEVLKNLEGNKGEENV